MKFENRQTQFPGRKRVRKLNSNNEQVEEYFVVMENAEGAANPEGTPVNSKNLEKANWRDDDSLSFTMLNDNELPSSMSSGTQIVTKANGETWIIPPGTSDAFELSAGSSVDIDTDFQSTLSDTSVPSTKLVRDSLLRKQDYLISKKPLYRFENNAQNSIQYFSRDLETGEESNGTLIRANSPLSMTNGELSVDLSGKQDTLAAGDGIEINGNLISVLGGGFPGYLPVFGNPVQDLSSGMSFNSFRESAGIERDAFGLYMLIGTNPSMSYLLTYTSGLKTILKIAAAIPGKPQIYIGQFNILESFMGFVEITTQISGLL